MSCGVLTSLLAIHLSKLCEILSQADSQERTLLQLQAPGYCPLPIPVLYVLQTSLETGVHLEYAAFTVDYPGILAATSLPPALLRRSLALLRGTKPDASILFCLA